MDGWVGARIEATSDRFLSGVLVLTTAVLGLPYALSGPGFIIDDFYALREASIEGWHMAAGSVQWSARPGAGVVYALVFGLIGNHPMAVYALQAVLVASAAVLVFMLARTWLRRPVAFGLAFTWLFLPNHSTLEYWASAINILVALVLVLAAFVCLARARPTVLGDLGASLLLAAGVLSYEAVGPIAAVGVVAIGWFERGGRHRLRLWIMSGAMLLLVAGWMLLNIHPEKDAADIWLSPSWIATGHFGEGLFGRSPQGQIASLMLLSTIGAVLGMRLLRSRFADRRSGPMFAIGGAAIVLGALPFIRYYYAPFGFGDRVTVVSGLGGAMILVGSGLELKRLTPAPVHLALAAAVLAVAVPWRYELARTYSTAGADGRRLLAELERRYPEPPDGPLVIGPYPVLENNVGPALQFDWPVQWFYGDRSVEVITTYDTTEFLTHAPSRRIDLLELTELDPDINPDRPKLDGR